jgi:sigma-B regulation protein RsbU (phosphoserine phosphatase)
VAELVERAADPDGGTLRSGLRDLLADAEARAADRSGGRSLDDELRTAQRIQRALVGLTETSLEGWDLASEYRPAREIGGDFFDAFPILDGDGPRRLGIVIADVSGKGISAALLMAFVRPVMRAAVDRTGSPAIALERTNRILVSERRTGLFVTTLCAVLDLETGMLTFANAGHEPPLLVPADGSEARWVSGGGPLLGAFERLDLEETAVRLEPGSRLVIYTDGVTDAVNPAGQRFGDARFLEAIASCTGPTADDLVAAITASLDSFQGGAEPADDLALLVVGRTA